jgi:hypothetical protein
MGSRGEEKAWNILSGLDYATVSANASVFSSEPEGFYRVRSFCTDFYIYPGRKRIHTDSQWGETVLKKYGYFFNHACLWYLVSVKNIPLTGRLVNPANIKGGELFFRGTHALPLARIEELYGTDRASFVRKGSELCGELTSYGDVSFKFFPLPRMPVMMILWLRDEEFPSRAELLFDSSCAIHMPVDIIWSIAMLSVLVMV